MASAVLAARAYDSSISLDEVNILTRSRLIVLSPLSKRVLALSKAFMLMCVWVKGPHRNAGKIGLKRDSIRSRLSRDKDIPSYLLKLLRVLYIYTYTRRDVPYLSHAAVAHESCREQLLSGGRCCVRGTARLRRASFEFGLSICLPNSQRPLTQAPATQHRSVSCLSLASREKRQSTAMQTSTRGSRSLCCRVGRMDCDILISLLPDRPTEGYYGA
jgi:hypothetical protein